MRPEDSVKSKLLQMLESETKRENAGKSQQGWQHL